MRIARKIGFLIKPFGGRRICPAPRENLIDLRWGFKSDFHFHRAGRTDCKEIGVERSFQRLLQISIEHEGWLAFRFSQSGELYSSVQETSEDDSVGLSEIRRQFLKKSTVVFMPHNFGPPVCAMEIAAAPMNAFCFGSVWHRDDVFFLETYL